MMSRSILLLNILVSVGDTPARQVLIQLGIQVDVTPGMQVGMFDLKRASSNGPHLRARLRTALLFQ
jgi:hypothetical protein